MGLYVHSSRQGGPQPELMLLDDLTMSLSELPLVTNSLNKGLNKNALRFNFPGPFLQFLPCALCRLWR